MLLSGERLQPAATTVQVWDGDVLTDNRASPDNKEQITGFCVVDCENLDEAIELAAEIPSAWNGTIEVRPAAQV